MFESLKGWIKMLFLPKAKEDFKIEPLVSAEMDRLLSICADVYKGNPAWLDAKDHIKTINFAKSLCSETARLTMLGAKISLDDSPRGQYLQEEIDKIYFNLRKWMEYACAYGTIALKPNGQSVDIVTPDNFTVTEEENGNVTAIVFQEQKRARDGKHYYVRLEYHRKENDKYLITNKTYYSESQNSLGNPIDIAMTPWKDLQEEVSLDNIEGNLYAILKMPQANNVDLASPMGMPLIYECIEELRDLDIAYSRNAKEILDSKRTILIDSDRMMLNMNGNIKNVNWDLARQRAGLPDMVKAVDGGQTDHMYQEINPLIQTPVRLEGMNALLSQIGYKVGFSNGYFVFNEQMGIQTATGVEASQQRTIQFIKDMRDMLESCLNQLISAMNSFADLYGLAPLGEYEVNYNFGDITYNYDEDRNRWWGYVMAQKIPAWKFFEKFEGMTEEEAKAIVAEATPEMPELFPQDEE